MDNALKRILWTAGLLLFLASRPSLATELWHGSFEKAADPNSFVIGTPTYTSGQSYGFEGAYCLRNCSDSNYVSVSVTTMAGLGTTGAIWQKMVVGDLDSWINKCPVSGQFTHGRYIVQLQPGNVIRVFFPTATGEQTLDSPANYFKQGKAFSLGVWWTANSFSFALTDVADNYVSPTVSTNSFAPNFSGCTNFNVGRLVGAAGFWCDSAIDGVSILDNTQTTDPHANNALESLEIIGASLSAGVVDGNSCGSTCGYRDTLEQGLIAAHSRMIFTGVNAACTIWINHHDSVPGQSTGDVLAGVVNTLKAVHSSYTSNNIVCLHADTAVNDARLSFSTSTAYANLTQTCALIYGLNQNIRIGLIKWPKNATYNNSVYWPIDANVQALFAAQGKTIPIIDMTDQTGYAYCTDNIHWTQAGYNAFGPVIAQRIQATFNPVVASSSTGRPRSVQSGGYQFLPYH